MEVKYLDGTSRAFDSLDAVINKDKVIGIDFCKYGGDVTGIYKFSNLQELNCSHTSIKTLDVIRDLPIRRLDCSNTDIYSLSPLQHNETLEYIDCSKTKIHNLEGLEFKSKLIEVICRLCFELESLEGLEYCRNLENLDISHNYKLSVLDDKLRTCSSLDCLTVEGLLTSNLDFIQHIRKLKYLKGNTFKYRNRDGEKPATLEFLKYCKDLEVLNIRGSQIESLEHVSQLSKLSFIDLSHTNIYNIDALESCKELTNIRIVRAKVSSFPLFVMHLPNLKMFRFTRKILGDLEDDDVKLFLNFVGVDEYTSWQYPGEHEDCDDDDISLQGDTSDEEDDEEASE